MDTSSIPLIFILLYVVFLAMKFFLTYSIKFNCQHCVHARILIWFLRLLNGTTIQATNSIPLLSIILIIIGRANRKKRKCLCETCEKKINRNEQKPRNPTKHPRDCLYWSHQCEKIFSMKHLKWKMWKYRSKSRRLLKRVTDNEIWCYSLAHACSQHHTLFLYIFSVMKF